jgi:hypothetical protein
MMEEERRIIQEQIRKGYEEIKKNVNPELDKYFWKLKSFLDILLNSDEVHSLILRGNPGIGKTYYTIQELVRKNIDFSFYSGQISPLEMFHILYENRENKVIVFDDVAPLLNNRSSFGILLQALWSPSGKERVCEWHTTSKKLKCPSIFTFKSKIIFITNEIPKNIEPLISRCLNFTLEFSYSELISLMYSIAKLPHPKLTKEERFEIVDFIRDHSSPATKNFSLRTQKMVEFLYLYCRDRWKELALEILKPDPELEIVRQLMEEYSSTKEQVKRFIEYGYSRATFFRLKKALLTNGKVDWGNK